MPPLHLSMKLLKILTILALVLFPFGEILRFDVGNNVVLKPLDIIVGITALIFLSSRLKWKDLLQMNFLKHNDGMRFLGFARNDIRLPVIVFSNVALVSLLINLTWLEPKDLLVSSLYLIRWISYASLVGIIWQFDEKFKKKLMALLFIDGVIIVLAGFLQYFFFNSLKSLYFLGWDEHMHRIFSVFFDPNFAGAFLVLFFLFLTGALHKHIEEKEYKESKILGIILGLTLIAVFLTFSRGALLSLVAGSVVFFVLIKRIKFLLVLFGFIALFIAVASPQFYDENMNLFRTASSKARIANYGTAFTFIQDRPLLGVGFNAYRYAKESYGYQTNWTLAPSHADAGVDNSFLFVLATTGIVGLSVYLWLWFTILKRAYYLHKKKGSVLGTVVIASSIALFVNAMFINSLFFAPLMLWMWVLVGLMEGLGSRG